MDTRRDSDEIVQVISHCRLIDSNQIEQVYWRRDLRLKRAAQLLEKKSATIVEIAYEVGFNNPSYFAECFRQQFGKSPSEYTSH